MNSNILFMPFFILVMPFFLFMLFKKRNGLGSRRLPPGPKGLPIIGNLHQLGNLPHRSLQRLSDKYGDFMFLKLASVPTIVVSSADLAREIFKTHDLAFSGRTASRTLRKLSYELSMMTFSPYGEYWREVRKIVVSELMTPKKIQHFEKIRVQEVAHMVDTIACSSEPINLTTLAFLVSNNVILHAAFGGANCDENGKFEEILYELQHLAMEFNIADYFPWMEWINKFTGLNKRLESTFEAMDTFFNKIIEDHVDPNRPKPEDEDLVDVLLRLQKDPNQTIALEHGNIKGVITDIFIAGSGTSAATVVWAMTELMRHPTIKRTAQNEVRKVAKGKQNVEPDDLPKLTYLKQVIMETLRLHPPAPLMVPRETIEDCSVRGYDIPARTRAFFNVAAIGTDPKYWDNPKVFDPDRFLDSQIDYKGQHFELLPFGAGRRGCPGINFAIPLVELELANLLFRFDWGLPVGVLAQDLDMDELPGVTVHKKTPLWLVASPKDVQE